VDEPVIAAISEGGCRSSWSRNRAPTLVPIGRGRSDPPLVAASRPRVMRVPIATRVGKRCGSDLNVIVL
jgi:hypothetical protein